MLSRSSAPRALLRRAVITSIAALALCVAAPAVASAAEYVAMGDSYASGTGTREYYEGCERSVYSYPYLLRSTFGSSFTHIACGGARTQDVLNNQVSRLDAGTKYVTISIGGNDAGFSSVIVECAKPVLPFQSNPCTPAVNNAQNFINNTLPGRLNNVYTEIRRRAPDAVVVVVGYPRLFNGEDCNAGTFFSGSEMTSLNQTADILAGVTRAKAREHGFTFVDARGAFIGHAVCDDQEWLNGLANPTSESYHPNRTGHSAGFAGIVRAAMQAAPSPDAPAGGVGRLAFASTRSGNSDVWVTNADGQFPENLTNHPAADVDPEWSPDGTKVAFTSNRDGNNEIYVMNGDGTGVQRLTNHAAEDRDPTWSPNGAYIAFRSDRTGNPEIFRMTATGGAPTNLSNNSASDWAPDWSPDGSEIAWQRFTGGSSTGQGHEVFKANADGQGQANLTGNAASINDGRPAWSPDGSTIAFHSNRTSGQFDIYTMGWAGGTATRRTTDGGSDEDPVWSPNGQQIAFHSNRTGNFEVFTMTATGGSQTNRSSNGGSDTAPAWQADSTPPQTSVTSGPSGPTDTATPQFELSSSEKGARLQCRIDNAPFADCTSPYTAPSLDDGEHTFSVRSIDPAGNPDPDPAVRTFVVDTTPPEVTVECPESVLLNSEAVATVEATDTTSGLADIDDPTGEHRLDTSAPGRQTFSSHAIDNAGNRGTAECTYVVRYPDPGTPRLSAGEPTNDGDFALEWDASAPADLPLRYALQRRDAGSDEWSTVASGLAAATKAFTRADVADEGTWTFRVRGVDSENELETGWSPVSDPVKVDQTAPRKPKLTTDRAHEYAGDGGWFADEVTVSTADDGDPDLRDGSAPSGVDPASVAAPETLDASGTVKRTVRDKVGNVSDEASLDVQIDSTPPELALECPETVELLDDVAVTVTASDAHSGLAEDPSGSVTVNTDSVGRKVIARTAVDNVGHSRTESCSVLVEYPTPGAPEITDGGNPNAGDYTLGWTRSAPAGYPLRYELERRPAAGDEWTLVADGLENPSRAFTRADRADEGTWRYRVRGVDEENDVETPWSEESAAVKVDQTAPAAPTITADRAPEYAGDGGWFADEVTLTTTDNGDPDLRDGSEPTGVDPDSVAGPETLDASGTERRTVRDRVGNTSAETAVAVQVDPKAPKLELTCPRSVVLRGHGVVEVAASDAHSGLASDPSGDVVVDTSEVGVQRIERTAVDNVGHEITEHCDVVVRYAISGLKAPFTAGEDGRTEFKAGSTIPLKFALSDAHDEGVEGVEYEVDLVQGDEVLSGGEVEDDGKHGLYHFNLSTRDVDPGEWTIRLKLDDTTVHRIRITLR